MNNIRRSFSGSQRARSRGFSLVELMIAMTIGMVVVITVMVALLSSGLSGKHASALGQMTEDASVALNVLRSQIAMAGYTKPYGVNATTGKFNRTYSGTAIFGCDKGFVDPATTGTPTCTTGTTVPDSIAIYYEADTSNTIESSSSLPTDCLGTNLTQTAAAGPVPAYFLAENRFYLDNVTKGGKTVPEIFCRGNGKVAGTAVAGAAMVSNVSDMQFLYGTATAGTTQVNDYKSASAITDWSTVISVRACVVVRSADNVMDEVTTYQGCNGSVTPAAGDRRMYRAFTTTVVLHNRIGA